MTEQQAIDALNAAANLLVIPTAALAWAGVLVFQYTTTRPGAVPWWVRGNSWGWHLMMFMLVMSVVLTLAVLRLFIAESIWFALARLGAFTGAPVVFAWRVMLFVQAHREGPPPSTWRALTMAEEDQLARVAYDAYRGQTGGVSAVSGEPLPTWDEQRPEVRGAWRAAAEAVRVRTEDEIADASA